MTQLTFVMYKPGSGGKFITELCDAISNRYLNKVQRTAKGNVRWNEVIQFNQFISGSQFSGHVHGFFEEQEHRSDYLDYIRRAADASEKKLNHLYIDVHYLLPDTVDYFLKENCQVIYINARREDRELMAKNFFYKNFLSNYEKVSVDHDNRMLLIDFLINDSANKEIITEQQKQRIQELVNDNVSLFKWDDEYFHVLYKFSEKSVSGRIESISRRSDSENMLNLDVRQLCQNETLEKLSEFLKVPMTSSVERRFNLYVEEQKNIDKPIDELISSFKTQEKMIIYTDKLKSKISGLYNNV